MPSSVNGIGTTLLDVSKRREIDGYVQFDAVEEFAFLYLPLVPYRAVHVLSLWPDKEGEGYQAMPLRLAPKLVLLAFLNAWGNALLLFGGLGLAVSSVAFMSMQRPMTGADRAVLFG